MVPLHELNQAQREAVLNRAGPLLVLAGAGSGKTRVIAFRMAALVEEGEAPESILALTFTQKAAGEMRERVASLVGKKLAKRLTVGTFHAFGAKLLRADVHRIGITNAFTILDEGDQRAQVRRLMRDARIDEKRAPVPDVIGAISLLKNRGGSPAALAASEAGRAAMQIMPAYDAHLRSLGAVDFDDLILLPVRMMREAADVAARIEKRFEHVLVDEFQDTSEAQLEFLLSVTARSRTVCAVGDDDQAIYGWRGAVVGHILEFEKHYPGAQVVALEQNYRSTPQILHAANGVIANNTQRRHKTLRTDAKDGLPVRIIVTNDEEQEVRAVVHDIAQRVADGNKPERFAILFRTGTQTRPFEAELRLQGIPYFLVGGPDLTDRREVKDALAYAAMLAGRDDEIAFRRVVATPARKVGPTSVEKVVQWARDANIPLIEAACGAKDVPGLQKKAAVVLAELGEKLRTARDVLRASAASDPTERLRAILDELGYWAMLDADEDLARGARRKASVEVVLAALTRLSTRIEESRQVSSEVQSRVALDEGSALDQLLDRMALDGSDDRKDDRDDERPGVRMMTLHAAKGLEFPVVYLPGWEDGLMPHRRSLEDAQAANAVPPEESPPPVPDEGPMLVDGTAAPVVHLHGVEEERRLAYVAITRAREELIITRAAARRRYGKMVPRLPSRFLAELPSDVEQVDRTDRPRTEEEERAHAAEMFRKLREKVSGP